MRDTGLDEAIRVAGGIAELAQRIGLSPMQLSNWEKIPVERVLAVESATGISRAILRPDLFGPPATGDADDIDTARAQEYALLSALLARAPDAALLERLGALRGDASALGMAHAGLAQAAADITAAAAEREYFDLFIGVGRGELVPYGSYYLTGFLQERPLARLRGDLSALGIARDEKAVEPEDHAAILCEIMSSLAGRRFAAPAGAERTIFHDHLVPWISRFFTDLERAERATFYRAVGTVGRVFITIEREAFSLPS